MSATPGQIDLAGNETEDPRLEKVAKALWWHDAKQTWGRDGTTADGKTVAEVKAGELWPRIRSVYMATARVAVGALDG